MGFASRYAKNWQQRSDTTADGSLSAGAIVAPPAVPPPSTPIAESAQSTSAATQSPYHVEVRAPDINVPDSMNYFLVDDQGSLAPFEQGTGFSSPEAAMAVQDKSISQGDFYAYALRSGSSPQDAALMYQDYLNDPKLTDTQQLTALGVDAPLPKDKADALQLQMMGDIKSAEQKASAWDQGPLGGFGTALMGTALIVGAGAAAGAFSGAGSAAGGADAIGTSGAAPGTLETANAVGAGGGDALGALASENAANWGVSASSVGGAAPGTLTAANAVGASGGDALGALIEGNAANWGVSVPVAAATGAATGSLMTEPPPGIIENATAADVAAANAPQEGLAMTAAEAAATPAGSPSLINSIQKAATLDNLASGAVKGAAVNVAGQLITTGKIDISKVAIGGVLGGFGSILGTTIADYTGSPLLGTVAGSIGPGLIGSMIGGGKGAVSGAVSGAAGSVGATGAARANNAGMKFTPAPLTYNPVVSRTADYWKTKRV